jgi:hypothetical protein
MTVTMSDFLQSDSFEDINGLSELRFRVASFGGIREIAQKCITDRESAVD